MNNGNISPNEMNEIKNLVDNGNIADAISHISPEMLQNFSKMLSNQGTTTPNQEQHQNQHQNQNQNQSQKQRTSNFTNNETNNQSNNTNFDFSGIDMNTIMKMSSVLGKMNNSKNDPRANLLNSLRPYLRDSKQGKLDNYMNLLNVSKIAEIMKNNDKENNNV